MWLLLRINEMCCEWSSEKQLCLSWWFNFWIYTLFSNLKEKVHLAHFRLSLNVLTLSIDSHNVYTQLGVGVSVTGIAQVRCFCISFASLSNSASFFLLDQGMSVTFRTAERPLLCLCIRYAPTQENKQNRTIFFSCFWKWKFGQSGKILHGRRVFPLLY